MIEHGDPELLSIILIINDVVFSESLPSNVSKKRTPLSNLKSGNNFSCNAQQSSVPSSCLVCTFFLLVLVSVLLQMKYFKENILFLSWSYGLFTDYDISFISIICNINLFTGGSNSNVILLVFLWDL